MNDYKHLSLEKYFDIIFIIKYRVVFYLPILFAIMENWSVISS
jgi:hypothetical protein